MLKPHVIHVLSLLFKVCLCIPEEDGLTIHCATQWMDLLQRRVALVLGISENRYIIPFDCLSNV